MKTTYRECPQIIENCEQLDITPQQERALLNAGLIYDSGENYYHIENGKTWADVDALLASIAA